MSNARFIKFVPDEWSFNPFIKSNKGQKCFVTGVDGKLVHAWSLSDWQWGWTELITDNLTLEENTEYKFSIWVKPCGNINAFDSASVLQVEVRFDGDFENRKIFVLSGDLIKPIKSYNGWKLYEITFKTESNEYTQLKIFALKYPVIVTTALEADAYDWIKDDSGEADYTNVRRDHVIEFFRDLIKDNMEELIDEIREEIVNNLDIDNIINEINDDLIIDIRDDVIDNLNDEIKDELINNMDTSEIIDEIKDDLIFDIRDELIENLKDELIDDLKDEIKEEIIDDIDVDSLVDEIKDEIADNLDY